MCFSYAVFDKMCVNNHISHKQMLQLGIYREIHDYNFYDNYGVINRSTRTLWPVPWPASPMIRILLLIFLEL